MDPKKIKIPEKVKHRPLTLEERVKELRQSKELDYIFETLVVPNNFLTQEDMEELSLRLTGMTLSALQEEGRREEEEKKTK